MCISALIAGIIVALAVHTSWPCAEPSSSFSSPIWALRAVLNRGSEGLLELKSKYCSISSSSSTMRSDLSQR